MKDSLMQSIRDEIKSILKKRFEIDIENVPNTNFCDSKLMGREIGLQPHEVLYLYFDIEKVFGITVPDNLVAEGKFDTINNIIGIVYGQIEGKQLSEVV